MAVTRYSFQCKPSASHSPKMVVANIGIFHEWILYHTRVKSRQFPFIFQNCRTLTVLAHYENRKQICKCGKPKFEL